MTQPMSAATLDELAELVSNGMAEIVVRVERRVRAEADMRERSLRNEIVALKASETRLRGKLKAVDAVAARPMRLV